MRASGETTHEATAGSSDSTSGGAVTARGSGSPPRFPAVPVVLVLLVITLVWVSIGVHLFQERAQDERAAI